MFFYEYGIMLAHDSNYFPQGNVQVKSSNKDLVLIMKKLVSDNGKDWHKKLYEILWADRISPKKEIGMSLFDLVYVIDAQVSLLVNLAASKLQTTIEDSFFQISLEKMIMYLTKLEDERNKMVDRIIEHQMRVKNIFDRNVRPRNFMPGDEVLLWDKRNEKKGSHKKIESLWKGPFRIH